MPAVIQTIAEPWQMSNSIFSIISRRLSTWFMNLHRVCRILNTGRGEAGSAGYNLEISMVLTIAHYSGVWYALGTKLLI